MEWPITDSASGSNSLGWSERLRVALHDANIPTLLLVLHHLTGDDVWIREPFRPHRGKPLDDNDSGGLSADLQAQVREAALDAVIAFRDGRLEPVTPSPQRVTEMLSCALAETVPPEYGELLSEEVGVLSRDVDIPSDAIREGFLAVVIGAGLSGLCMALKLAAAGIRFVILEKDGDLGGTWLENVYPGCGVDARSYSYSYSFAPNPDITHYFAKRNEIHDYLLGLASDFDIRDHIQYCSEVVRARFQATDEQGALATSPSRRAVTSMSADVLAVSAIRGLTVHLSHPYRDSMPFRFRSCTPRPGTIRLPLPASMLRSSAPAPARCSWCRRSLMKSNT